MRAAVSPAGFLASAAWRTNYRRVWARDSMVCGLAAIASQEPDLIDAMGASLQTLAENCGRDGLLPSNVAADGKGPPSYGGLAGRVDAGAWFVVGACHYLTVRPNDNRRALFERTMRGCLKLYDAWELNARGLVNVPMGGCWADEYPLHGYTLTEQALRVWALRLASTTLSDPTLEVQGDSIQATVEHTFWIDATYDGADSYHPMAYQRLQQQDPTPGYWMAALSPGGYQRVFDALANALVVMLKFGNTQSRNVCLTHGTRLSASLGDTMVPAFWPPIVAGDPLWSDLQALCAHGFRNNPGEYHNGGLWPMVNGFWGLALVAEGKHEEAASLLRSMQEANLRRRPGDESAFFEYHVVSSDTPRGTPSCTWSAAGEILLAAALQGHQLTTAPREEVK